MKTSRGYLRTYSQIKKRVLNSVNVILKETEILLPGVKVRLLFSERLRGSFMSKIFTENGLIGMILASQLDSINQVSSFIRAIVDLMCGNESSPKITELFTSYADICMVLEKDSLSHFWSKRELSSLREKFRAYNAMKKRVWAYQASNMDLRKCHLRDHLVGTNSCAIEIEFFSKSCMGPHAKNLNDYTDENQKDVALLWMKRSSCAMGKC